MMLMCKNKTNICQNNIFGKTSAVNLTRAGPSKFVSVLGLPFYATFFF